VRLLKFIRKWFRCKVRNLHEVVRDTAVQSLCPHCGGHGLIAMTSCCKMRRFVHPDEVTA